jgi:hypothetical protein
MVNTTSGPETREETISRFQEEIENRADFVEALNSHYHSEHYSPQKIAQSIDRFLRWGGYRLKIELTEMTLAQFLALCCMDDRDFERDVEKLLEKYNIDSYAFGEIRRENILENT